MRWFPVLAAAAAAPVVLPAGAVRWVSRHRLLTRGEALATRPGDLPTTALVLGAQVWPGGRPSRYLRGRLALAAELFHAGLVERLIVSGAGAAEHHDEPGAMRRHLEQVHGIPGSAIVEDPAGFDTYDSCRRARDEYGAQALTVVSQSFHLPRAVTICRALGVEAVGVGDESVRDGSWPRFALREYGANVKMLWDLGTHRAPSTPVA